MHGHTTLVSVITQRQHANFRISADKRGEGTYHHAGPNELIGSQLHVGLAPHPLGNRTHDSRRKRYAVRILVPLAVCKDKEDCSSKLSRNQWHHISRINGKLAGQTLWVTTNPT